MSGLEQILRDEEQRDMSVDMSESAMNVGSVSRNSLEEKTT